MNKIIEVNSNTNKKQIYHIKYGKVVLINGDYYMILNSDYKNDTHMELVNIETGCCQYFHKSIVPSKVFNVEFILNEV